MDILFASQKLERLCHDETLATRTLGQACARKLRARLDDLAAAAHLGHAPRLPGRFHQIRGEWVSIVVRRELMLRYCVDLLCGSGLVIRPAPNPVPTRADGTPDLAQITAVCVEYIGDYHD